MKAYVSLVSSRFRSVLQYRSAALAGMVTQIFFGTVMVMVMEAFYSSSNRQQPISLTQVIDYVWLGQTFFFLLPATVDRDIQEMIRNGNVAYELVRPLNLYSVWFARSFAWRVASTLLRAVPLLLFVYFVLPYLGLKEYVLKWPYSSLHFIAFIVTMLGAVALSTVITVFMNILTIWTLSGQGINMMMATLVYSLSGMVVPLPLFPDSFQCFVRLAPFSGLVDTPYRFYNGNFPIESLGSALLHQLFWIVFFVIISHVLLHYGKKKLSVQGG